MITLSRANVPSRTFRGVMGVLRGIGARWYLGLLATSPLHLAARCHSFAAGKAAAERDSSPLQSTVAPAGDSVLGSALPGLHLQDTRRED
jgi:hypothetical protein